MGFFATFWTWLDALLTRYIGNNAAHLATAMEPAIVTMATLYVMIWGYLQLTGRVEEPFVFGLKRILTVAIVLGVSLRMWLYNEVIVNLFYTAPAELAAVIIRAPDQPDQPPDPVHIIDSIWERGGAVAGYLWNNAGVLHTDIGYDIAGAIVWILIGLLCVYTMFLISLARIALSILLALGPFFVCMLLFESTKRLFDAWLAQMANYALVTVLTVMAAALLLQEVESYAVQTANRGTALTTVDALNMVLISVLTFLLMRQVMPIASGLAGGAAFNTFGTVSRAIGWSVRAGTGVVRSGTRTALERLLRDRG
jgi:type IV secretion system protein VirB6